MTDDLSHDLKPPVVSTSKRRAVRGGRNAIDDGRISERAAAHGDAMMRCDAIDAHTKIVRTYITLHVSILQLKVTTVGMIYDFTRYPRTGLDGILMRSRCDHAAIMLLGLHWPSLAGRHHCDCGE